MKPLQTIFADSGLVVLATEEAEAEGWQISDLSGLESKFKANLNSSVRSCLKIKGEKGGAQC